ncbi:MAG: glycosyltransferase family 2 protein [Pseudomonadales bacterium]|nr:glycosyltransferase family 2 protein [Candidatus Woesebacteria bacterium]MCB9802200.1 glycosyltransferase family 2 protein [Pseudomonadales bacterium]
MSGVSVVIPTYNGVVHLQKNIPAVLSILRDQDEVVIVDDASGDETKSWLEQTYGLKQVEQIPQVPTPRGYYPDSTDGISQIAYGSVITATAKKMRIVLVALRDNIRFAGAANIGVLLSSHRFVLLLNNDVRPMGELIAPLLAHFDDEVVFAVGCREVEADNHQVVSGKNKLWFEKGLFFHQKADDMSGGETAWASGGSALFDREKWLELGGFDKAYHPAYWEDVDLSFRARKRGWKVLFEPTATVAHDHETTNRSVFGRKQIQAMSWNNAQTFVWKNGTLKEKFLHLLWKPYWKMKYDE